MREISFGLTIFSLGLSISLTGITHAEVPVPQAILDGFSVSEDPNGLPTVPSLSPEAVIEELSDDGPLSIVSTGPMGFVVRTKSKRLWKLSYLLVNPSADFALNPQSPISNGGLRKMLKRWQGLSGLGLSEKLKNARSTNTRPTHIPTPKPFPIQTLHSEVWASYLFRAFHNRKQLLPARMSKDGLAISYESPSELTLKGFLDLAKNPRATPGIPDFIKHQHQIWAELALFYRAVERMILSTGIGVNLAAPQNFFIVTTSDDRAPTQIQLIPFDLDLVVLPKSTLDRLQHRRFSFATTPELPVKPLEWPLLAAHVISSPLWGLKAPEVENFYSKYFDLGQNGRSDLSEYFRNMMTFESEGVNFDHSLLALLGGNAASAELSSTLCETILALHMD